MRGGSGYHGLAPEAITKRPLRGLEKQVSATHWRVPMNRDQWHRVEMMTGRVAIRMATKNACPPQAGLSHHS